MCKRLVLYESKVGYTKKYAQWIAEETEAAFFSLKDCREEMIKDADLVIFGGGVNGSIINGQKKFAKRMKRYPDKKIIYFATGIRPATERTKDLIRKNNFETKETICFYFRGGLDLDKLAPGDRTLLRIYCAMMKRRGSLHREDEEVLALLSKNGDYSSKEQIQPLVETVKRMFKK